MGLWDALGHFALQYGPMIAAPFTGGASLALTPYTNMANKVWGGIESNGTGPGVGIMKSLPPPGTAGIGPSSMITVREPDTYGPTGITKKGGNVQIPLSSLNVGGKTPYADASSQSSQPTSSSQPMSQGMGNGMIPQNSNNPNLSTALNQGRMMAQQNQRQYPIAPRPNYQY